MSVILVTGPTGGGKTALVVDMLAHTDEFKGRPLFVMGIPDLKIEHQPTPPVDQWTEHRGSPEDPNLTLPYFVFPPHSVIVIDEAQRVYRPRAATSKVPDIEAAFETHRHTGVDFILITQTPNQISSHVRRLVVRHIHIHQSSLKRELLEWATPGGGDPESRTSRELATRRNYSPPKRAFDLYKSAEAHTKLKRRLPRTLFVAVAALVLALVLGAVAVHRLKSKVQGQGGEVATASPGQKPAQSTKAPEVKTTAAYLMEREPRIAGLHHTAPIYDAVTQPTEAPIPMGCIQNHKLKTCRCIDQQGNNYQTSAAICEGIVKNGLFVAWRPKEAPTQTGAQPPTGAVNAGSGSVPQPVASVKSVKPS